jgi:hypothetical protein
MLIDRSEKQINRDTSELNDTIDQTDLIDFYRILRPTAEEYTFFSAAHGTLSKIGSILGYKANLNKYKKIQTIFRLQ